MHKVQVTFEVSLAEGRVPDPSDPNNYNLVIRDAIREDGIVVDTDLNVCGVPGEYSKQPYVLVVVDES